MFSVEIVNVNVDKVDGVFVVVGSEEFFYLFDVYVGVIVVGDGRWINVCFVLEWVYEFFVFGSGNFGGEVSLGFVIGFVEVEKVWWVSVDGFLGIGRLDLSKI